MSLTGLLFLAAFAGGLSLAFIRHPVYGLYTYVAVFYLHPPARWWGSDLPDVRWAFVAAAVSCVALLFKRDARERPPWATHGIHILFVIYVAWMWIQTMWALNPEEHQKAVILFTKYVVVSYLIYSLVDNRERLIGFLTAHVLGCLYLGYLAWSSNVSGRLDGVGGPGIDDASSLGMQLATGAFVAAGLFLTQKSWVKWVSALAIPFALNGIVLAASRGGFLAFVCGGAAFYFFRPARQFGRIALYAFIGLIGFGYLASDFFWERVETIGAVTDKKTQVDGSVETRLVLFGKQLEMAMDHPLGGGHQATTELSYTYIPERYHSKGGGRSSHNTFMSALVDQGFPGLIIWLSMLLLLARNLLKVRSMAREMQELAWINASLAASVAALVVAGQFAPFLKQEIYIWLFSLSGSLTWMVRSACAMRRPPAAAQAADSRISPPLAPSER